MNYKIVKRCEYDNKIDEIYQAMHNVDASDNLGDITKVECIPDCDILFHSSPCQNFSNINMTQKTGGEEGSNSKSSLMWETIRLLKQTPSIKIVIWENVKAVNRGINKPNFDKYIKTLDDLGYDSIYKVLNPKDFGVPQNRPRMFVVSIKRDVLNSKLFSMPIETYEKYDLFSVLDKEVDDKYTVPKQVMIGYDNKKSIFRDRWLIKEPGSCGYCLVAKSSRSTITCNYVMKNFDEYKNPPCSFNSDGLHFLATHTDEHPVRALTPVEFFRLQSIPDEYYERAVSKNISDSRLFKAMGNGINAKIIYLIYKQLYVSYPELFENMKQVTCFSGVGCQEVGLDMLYKEINGES